MRPDEILSADPTHAAILEAVHTGATSPAWSRRAFATLLAQPGVAGWIALAGGTPVGLLLARAAADEAEILTLAVLPENRRRGIARELLAALKGWAANQRIRRLFLEVGEDNTAARALYAAAGFETVGRRSDYYGPGLHALTLAHDAGDPDCPADAG